MAILRGVFSLFLIDNRLYLRLRQNFPGKQSLKPFSNPLFPKTVKLPLYFAVDLKIPFAQSKKSVAAKMQIVAVPHLLLLRSLVSTKPPLSFSQVSLTALSTASHAVLFLRYHSSANPPATKGKLSSPKVFLKSESISKRFFE